MVDAFRKGPEERSRTWRNIGDVRCCYHRADPITRTEVILKSVVLILMAAFPCCLYAQVYRWIDERGKVHYGDRPIAAEVKRVPGLADPTELNPVPRLGMSAAAVRNAYGDPARLQKVSTGGGATETWYFTRSNKVKRDFLVRIEGGVVVEVANDIVPPEPTVAGVASRGMPLPMIAERAPVQAMPQQQETESKQSRCADLRRSQEHIASLERRGGSAATMDDLRERKRRYGDQMWSAGCGS